MTYALTLRPAARSTWLGLEGNARCRDTRVEANRSGGAAAEFPAQSVPPDRNAIVGGSRDRETVTATSSNA